MVSKTLGTRLLKRVTQSSRRRPTDPPRRGSRGRKCPWTKIIETVGSRSKLGCGNRNVNDTGNLPFVGATDNSRKCAELPASQFNRLKAFGIPIERHLLVKEFASDPPPLRCDAETFERFRNRAKGDLATPSDRNGLTRVRLNVRPAAPEPVGGMLRRHEVRQTGSAVAKGTP
jgi:hypothetical protein